jgi:hypothetical protein
MVTVISLQIVACNQEKRGKMKKLLVSVFVMIFVGGVFALSPVWGAEKNLSENPEMTARIQAFDPEDFTQDFNVFFAGYSLEGPVALLFDRKDNNHLPSRFWSEPLNQEEIVYAIRRMKNQYIDHTSQLPFIPRALNVVDLNGKVLGFVYFGGIADLVVMDRKVGRNVTVFNPTIITPQYSYPIFQMQIDQRGLGPNISLPN